MMGALGIALCYLGNRASGETGYGTAWGIPLQTFGLWLQHPYPIWALLLIALSVLNFRVWSTHSWFAVFQEHKWGSSFVRGAAVLPLAAMLTFLQWHVHLHLWWTPAVLGIASTFLFSVDYWLGARIAVWTRKTKYPVETVATSELLVGANLGTIGL